jgi:hypothetical protein
MAVTGLEVQARAVVAEGRPFGAAGAYEKVVGVIRFAFDPAHPRSRAIPDIGLAPRDGQGRVEAWADFHLLQPVDGGRGNGALLLDVANRGRKVALSLFNSTPRVPDPTAPAEFGNGFLMRHGFTVAWVGWQADVPRQDGLMALTVPRAPGVTGLVRCEFRPNERTPVLPLADRYHVPQPTADPNDPEARLTVREHGGAPETAVPRTAWRFPDPTHVALDGGFAPGKIYDLLYRAQDPPLVGLGFLAVLDTAAFLRRAAAGAGNPAAGRLGRAIAFGTSQSGRFLRHLLYLGLTEDEDGRPAFDAVVPHVAGARRGEFALRFGQPSLNALHALGSLFPFTHAAQRDPVTGERDGLLERLRGRSGAPKVVEVNSSAEYWRGDGSLVHTDVEATGDVAPPAGVRVYHFAGTQHMPGPIPPPAADPNTGSRGRHAFNVVDYAPLLRATLVNLDRWLTTGAEPPPSTVPRLADGTAVPAEATAAVFRAIPGARFPDRLARPARLDFGPETARGIAALPPKVGAPFATLVAAVDADGNERAGVLPVELRVPLATSTGWNPRHPDQGAPGDLMSMMGSTLPFPRTAEERARTSDPRRSIAERYPSRAAYLGEVRAAAAALVAERHVLAEDVDGIAARAGELWDFVHAAEPPSGHGP